MKKTLFVLLFLSVIVLPAQASSGERFMDGLKNFASAPLEIPKKTAYYAHETNYHPFGIAAGLAEGGTFMTIKMLKGLVQMLTFPVDPTGISYDSY